MYPLANWNLSVASFNVRGGGMGSSWVGVVWDGMKRLVSVTSWLVWAVTISGLSLNVNILLVSVGNGLMAAKPPTQVAISCSGRVSISGSIWTSGATLIPRPFHARDLVTITEVGSGWLPSLGPVTTASDRLHGAMRRNSTRCVRPRDLCGWDYRFS